MRKLPRDLVLILRTEAKNQRTPPIDYVVAEDGGRMVHRPDPDIAMAELLEEAAAALSAAYASLAAVEKERDTWRDNFSAMHRQAMAAEVSLAEARKALEWQPIETAPLNVGVDLWCIEADSPASWGNERPAGEIVRNRHKSGNFGWFGNQSNDGVPRGHMPDLVPVAWRHPIPEVPLAMVEAFIAARAARRALAGGRDG